MLRMLSRDDLRARGIKFSRQHLHRLIRQKRFPAPVKIGANTNAWLEPEIDEYLANCVAKRDSATQPPRRRTDSEPGPDLTQLKKEMAEVHPDRGGRELYVAARGQMRRGA
jgi:prophage regulatory protein